MTAGRVPIRLEPLGVELDVPSGGSLVAGLAAHGVEFPCGGMGECGGCGVRVLSGSLPVTDADRSIFTPDQFAAGWRLACQVHPDSSPDTPLVLECAQWHMEVLTDNEVGCPILSASAVVNADRAGSRPRLRSGLGVAIDLGTTTIAAQLIDLATGDVLAVETALNPQSAFGSDVMSRIRAALEGRDLTSPIRSALGALVARLAAGRESQIAEILLVGNTVMHHLFCGLSVEPLSHVPFESPHLAEQRFTPRDLAWNLPHDCSIRFVRCIGGFVGSDILAGIIATGIAQRDDLTALVDLGTNGEIAIGNRYGIVCASTAAGPAFEAGSIRMGMRAVSGAIAYVSPREGALHVTVIGDVQPRGICGSGVIDAVAAGLRTCAILPSGRVANGTKLFPLVPSVAPPVVLYQSDIRELQLAKGAIAAGFRLLLKHLGCAPEQVGPLKGHGAKPSLTLAKDALIAEQSSALKGHDLSHAVTNANERRALAPEGNPALLAIHLAGAFGNYVQIESAIRIGLLEFPHTLIHAAGNTALRGAKLLLLVECEPTLPPIEHISLAADPAFQDEFAACMSFPNYESESSGQTSRSSLNSGRRSGL
jgi:uncharacterized 2Fe-2S/4Fe-4S cluster protein (DUF4445 family)